MKLLLLLLTFIILSLSRPYYPDRIPNGYNVYHNGSLWPGVGHYLREGTGARNPFGLDFQKAGYMWTPSLCAMDSDKDGFTNGEELGDPNCIWTQGITPTRTTNITHPGFPANVTGPYDPDCYLDRSVGAQNATLTFPTDFTVPSSLTSYYCTSFTLPSDKEYFAIKYHPIIKNFHMVHHMILYVCANPPQQGTYECGKMQAGCDNILYAWALGAPDFCLPSDVGIVFGKDEATHVLLQIHYDNPHKLSTIKDSSGVEITYTSQVQSNPAGFLRLGYSAKFINIPPGKPEFEVVGKCLKKSSDLLPYDIYAFAYAHHMHKLGRRIWTTQLRSGAEFSELGRNDYYDFNLQTFSKFDSPKVISKGDELLTHCVYNSTGITTYTTGGESTFNEMCFNFLVYYPRIKNAPACISQASTLSAGVTVLFAIFTFLFSL